MTASFDSLQYETMPVIVDDGLVRLFHFDVPVIRRTGKTLLEQTDTASIKDVLDIACGLGEWAIENARAYKHMHVTGIDAHAPMIEYAHAQIEARDIQNVSFKVIDPFGPLGFPDGYFDLVNARFIVNLLPAERWPAMLRECMRVLKPGGCIRLTESDLPSSNCPAFERLNGLVSRAFWHAKHSFSPGGRVFSITPMLGYLVQVAGFQDIQSFTHVVNFSKDGEDHHDICRNFAQAYHSVRPFLVNTGVITAQEFEQTYQQMLVEMQSDDFCAVGFFLTVCGKKA